MQVMPKKTNVENGFNSVLSGNLSFDDLPDSFMALPSDEECISDHSDSSEKRQKPLSTIIPKQDGTLYALSTTEPFYKQK